MQPQPVEKVFGMEQASIRIQEITGYKPSRSTLWRWIQAGRLQTKRLGTRYYTNETWIRECVYERLTPNFDLIGLMEDE
jgi:hypothetical protein